MGNAVRTSGSDAERGYVEETFERDTRYIQDRIAAGGERWPVEPGRYRLVVARACPWANRASIVRRLLGLEEVLSMGVCGPTHDARSWTFDLDPGSVDPSSGFRASRTPTSRGSPTTHEGSPCPASSTSRRVGW